MQVTDIEAQLFAPQSPQTRSQSEPSIIDLTAHDSPSCITRVSEACSDSLGNIWHRLTYYIDFLFESLEAYIEHKYGGKLSTEDFAALLLLSLSLFEGAFSSRVWISARAEFFISAIISVFTLMNDRRNYIMKASVKASLQRDFVRILQQTNILVKKIYVRGRSKGTYIELSKFDIANILEKYWVSCSHMRVEMQDGSKHTLHNLYNIKNRYAQFNSVGIILSWCCVLINITFNIIKIFYPVSYLADGILHGTENNFSAQVTIDVSNVFSEMPLNGNFSFADYCQTNGTFDGFVDVPYSPLSNPYARRADHAFTILSGVPFRTICSWIIVFLIQQQLTVRIASKKIAERLQRDYFGAIDAQRMAIAIPHELPIVLSKTQLIHLALEIYTLSGVVAAYNARLAQENTFYHGMARAGEAFASGISAANDARRQQLLETKSRLEENIRVLQAAGQAVEADDPELAGQIKEECRLANAHARGLEDKCAEEEHSSNATRSTQDEGMPELNTGRRILLFGQPVNMQPTAEERQHLINLHNRYPDSTIFNSPRSSYL